MRRAAPIYALLALAACGTNLPRDEFVNRAERDCAAASQRASADGDPAVREQAVKSLESELKTLVPPRELAPEYGDLIIHLAELAKDGNAAETAALARSAGVPRCASAIRELAS